MSFVDGSETFLVATFSFTSLTGVSFAFAGFSLFIEGSTFSFLIGSGFTFISTSFFGLSNSIFPTCLGPVSVDFALTTSFLTASAF